MDFLETRGPYSYGPWTVTQVVEWEGEAFPHSFLFPDLSAAEIRAASPAGVEGRLTEKGMIITSTQFFVLQRTELTILIEQGTGNGKTRPDEPYWDHQSLPYLQTLAKLGIAPEQVDYVFFSHLHPDHVGLATMFNGKQWEPTFPRAKYVLSKQELKYWTEPPMNDPKLPPFIDDSVIPLINHDCIQFAKHGDLIGGLRVHEAPGHTPGNLLFQAEESKLWLIGDLLHHPAQVVRPEWASGSFDENFDGMLQQRRKYFKKFAADGAHLLAVHMGNSFQIQEAEAGRFAIRYDDLKQKGA
jgi:glyoxylase-like metal-dependent hydrolase (beta-lactamase superfamily II)